MSGEAYPNSSHVVDRHAHDAIQVTKLDRNRCEVRVYRTEDGEAVELQRRSPTGLPISAIRVPQEDVGALQAALDELVGEEGDL